MPCDEEHTIDGESGKWERAWGREKERGKEREHADTIFVLVLSVD